MLMCEVPLYADIAAAFAWLAETHNALPKNVILYGRSIGALAAPEP